MLKYIKWLFNGTEPNYSHLIKEGAVIIDVRTAAEYRKDHLNGSINIPVELLNASLIMLPDKRKPIITCCASGIRSASAKTILKANGYLEVYNAGKWDSLQTKI